MRVSRDTITDTELQIGQFVVPLGGTIITNHTTEALYPRVPRELLPKEHVCNFHFSGFLVYSLSSSGFLMHIMVKGNVGTDTMYLMKCVLLEGVWFYPSYL